MKIGHLNACDLNEFAFEIKIFVTVYPKDSLSTLYASRKRYALILESNKINDKKNEETVGSFKRRHFHLYDWIKSSPINWRFNFYAKNGFFKTSFIIIIII